jgi:hypothetical protein
MHVRMHVHKCACVCVSLTGHEGHRRLVTFGIVRNLLRRVHKYIVFVPGPVHAAAAAAAAAAGRERVVEMVAERPRTFDDVCAQLCVSADDLLALVAADPRLHVYIR